MSQHPRGDLEGLTAVVTGSSSGIGRAIALELAAAGADCAVHARANRAGADATAEEVRRLGRQSLVILGDLSQAATCEALVRDAWAWHGVVDIWVNNAGADVLTGEAAKWDFARKLETLQAIDVAATMHLSRAAGALMNERGSGTIVNMGWSQALVGMAGDSGQLFAATKAAVAGFTMSLARSLAPRVRVNCVAPGWIRTAWADGASNYWHQRACDESLLARWGTPEDVARVVRFLASPAAAFINAQIVAVDGGLKPS
jgi:3-oxoacyl-[acyl-carrier protein] reductase